MQMRFGISFLLASLIVLAGCSDGGNSSSPPVLAAPTSTGNNPGFVAGVFGQSDAYASRCINPRSGIDPYGNPFPDMAGTYIDENNLIRSFSNATYLWYDEIIDVNSANQSDQLDYFEVMKTLESNPSGNLTDTFHLTRATEPCQQYSQSGITSGY